MCVGLFVLWVASRITFSIFEAAPEHLERLFCLFWRDDHTKSWARMKLRDQKKGWRVLASQKQESGAESQTFGPGARCWSVGSKF